MAIKFYLVYKIFGSPVAHCQISTQRVQITTLIDWPDAEHDLELPHYLPPQSIRSKALRNYKDSSSIPA